MDYACVVAVAKLWLSRWIVSWKIYTILRALDVLDQEEKTCCAASGDWGSVAVRMLNSRDDTCIVVLGIGGSLRRMSELKNVFFL